jgi:hypothetical protein
MFLTAPTDFSFMPKFFDRNLMVEGRCFGKLACSLAMAQNLSVLRSM